MSVSLNNLLSHPAIWRASSHAEAAYCQQQGLNSYTTSFAVLDRELPEGGWPSSHLVELLLPRNGRGEMPLLTPVLARLTQQQRWVALVAPPWMPYVPALIRHGVNL